MMRIYSKKTKFDWNENMRWREMPIYKGNILVDYLGKFVFLTKEEAEKKLKEIKNDR